MERIVRTLRVDGHNASVVESMDEDGPSFLLVVDGVVANADAALARIPSDTEIRAAVSVLLAHQ